MYRNMATIWPAILRALSYSESIQQIRLAYSPKLIIYICVYVDEEGSSDNTVAMECKNTILSSIFALSH